MSRQEAKPKHQLNHFACTEEDPSRRNKFDGNLVLSDTTDTMRVPMQPTDDNRAKYARSLVNTIDRPKYR